MPIVGKSFSHYVVYIEESCDPNFKKNGYDRDVKGNYSFLQSWVNSLPPHSQLELWFSQKFGSQFIPPPSQGKTGIIVFMISVYRPSQTRMW